MTLHAHQLYFKGIKDGSIHVEGLNLDPANAGLYAARIVSSTNEKKATVIGPANMTYDKATHQFTLSFEA